MSTIRILIADEQKIVREGLRLLFKKESRMEVIAEAENSREAVQLAQKLRPNVVIMDVIMPDMNGIDATRRIMEETSGVRVIALSTHSDRRYVLGMLKAGACGFLHKNCAFEELATAVRKVAGRSTYLSPMVAEAVAKGYLANKAPGPSQGSGSLLTPREREVLQLLAEGMKAKVIASHLNLGIKTVETHRRNVMQKLKIKNIVGLTKYAVREGLVDIEG